MTLRHIGTARLGFTSAEIYAQIEALTKRLTTP